MKRILKRTTGVFLLSLPFMVMLAALLHEHGVRGVLIIGGLAALTVGVLFFGVKLTFE